MDMQQQITSFHLDVLKEIGNIGAAHSATSLSALLNTKIDMHVPQVEMVSFNDMMERVGGAETFVTGIYLRIEGDIKGGMFFIMPIEQANALIRKLIHEEQFDFANQPSELGLSAMQEMGNILSGSYLSALSDFTKLKLYPTPPALASDMFGAIISIGLIEISQISDYVIVIDTSIIEEDETDKKEEVSGHFFLIPDPDSFSTIFKSLGVE